MRFHPDTAIGSGCFYQTRDSRATDPATRFVSRVECRCAEPGCLAIEGKNGSYQMPLNVTLRHMHEQGWEIDVKHRKAWCPIHRRSKKKLGSMAPALAEALQKKNPIPIIQAVPAQAIAQPAPRILPANPQQLFPMDIRVGITSGSKDKDDLRYIISLNTHFVATLSENRRKIKFFYHDGRLIMVFGDEGAQIGVTPTGKYHAVQPGPRTGAYPKPQSRTGGGIILACHHDGHYLVTDKELPDILKPASMLSLNFLLGSHFDPVFKIDPAKMVQPPGQQLDVDPLAAYARITSTAVAPSPIRPLSKDAAVEAARKLFSEPAIKGVLPAAALVLTKVDAKKFPDSDVQVLLRMIDDCRRVRPDVSFSVDTEGNIVASKLVFQQMGKDG